MRLTLPVMATIHWNWSVLSARGCLSLSGYSISVWLVARLIGWGESFRRVGEWGLAWGLPLAAIDLVIVGVENAVMQKIRSKAQAGVGGAYFASLKNTASPLDRRNNEHCCR